MNKNNAVGVLIGVAIFFVVLLVTAIAFSPLIRSLANPPKEGSTASWTIATQCGQYVTSTTNFTEWLRKHRDKKIINVVPHTQAGNIVYGYYIIYELGQSPNEKTTE